MVSGHWDDKHEDGGDASSPSDLIRKISTRTAWYHDPENPHNWPRSRKWAILLLTGFMSFAAGVNSTSIATPGNIISAQFHVDNESFPNSYWPITSWTMGAAIGPMLGMPLIENFGTRRGYLITYALFFLFVIPQAVAQNFATLVVVRAFAGFFGGTLQNAMESFCTDMFRTSKERNLPISIFVLVYEGGVILGPTYGSIFYSVSWRWVFYSQLIIFGALFPAFFFVIKETRAHVIAEARKRSEQAKSADDKLEEAKTNELAEDKTPLKVLFYEAIIRPAILLTTEPVVLSMALWGAFCFAIVFISIQSIESVYATNYGFNDAQLGLVQISLFIGLVLGFIATPFQNNYYERSASRNTENPGTPIPEARLLVAVPASFIGLAGGLFWYGWASFPFLHWALPSAGFILIGFAIMVIVTAAVMYLTDAYMQYAGSAVAAAALCENTLAAWIPLSTPRMYEVLGYRWASSLLGFVAIVLSCAPLLLMIKGRQIRARSTYMTSH